MIEKDESSDIIPYRFEVVGRNTQVSEAMRQYAIEKICKIERFHPKILDVHVTLDIQKMEQSCVIVIHTNNIKIKVHASSNDMTHRSIEPLKNSGIRSEDGKAGSRTIMPKAIPKWTCRSM